MVTVYEERGLLVAAGLTDPLDADFEAGVRAAELCVLGISDNHEARVDSKVRHA